MMLFNSFVSLVFFLIVRVIYYVKTNLGWESKCSISEMVCDSWN